MSDLALYRRSDGNFDLAFDEGKGDLLTSESLENVVIISIGTYARERNLGRVANLKPCVGGWWGDALDEKGTLGGYLFEAFPGKLKDETAKSVERLAVEALSWMVEDGIVKNVDCVAAVSGEETMNVEIRLEKPTGEQIDPIIYEIKWKATDGI